MARRHREEGPSLESDSFLDIVANIVGILIILIVIVGVRVGQSASKEAAQTAVAQTAPTPAPVVAPRPVVIAAVPEAIPTPTVSPKLMSSIEATRRNIDRLQGERKSLQKQSQQLNEAQVTLTAQATSVVDEQRRLAELLEASEVRSEQVDGQLDELRSEFDGLGRQISDVPTEKVAILRHRLNPIGREVHGEELHFRIAAGRVARIPIKELVELLKPEIEREKDWIAKFRRHRGRVGPIEGFSMDYVVERQRLSVVEQLQQGTQVMRISVSGWKVTAEPDLIAEPVDVALAGHSKYRSALALADADTTITFWVYPDSFEAYRRLQEHAYTAGFTVAARPLPDGVPIAGSPNGSRSSSQ